METAPAEAQAGGAAPGAAGEGAAGEAESPEDIARRVAAQWIPGAKREEGEAQAQPGSGGSEGAAASGAGAEEEGEQPLGEDNGDLGPAEDEGEEDQIPEEDPILEDAGYDPAHDLAAGEEDLYPGGGEVGGGEWQGGPAVRGTAFITSEPVVRIDSRQPPCAAAAGPAAAINGHHAQLIQALLLSLPCRAVTPCCCPCRRRKRVRGTSSPAPTMRRPPLEPRQRSPHSQPSQLRRLALRPL